MSGSVELDLSFIELQLALAGRYSIDREIGRGGMGIVYLAREVHLDRPVAIKLLPPDLATPELRERFLREARTAAKLSHPNIIPIHSVEETERFVYFVMAYVDGETLTDRVRTRGPLGASEGTRILREVAWALAYAHEQGLVHRDVKPDNILVEHGTGRVLVADFGIAAVIDQTCDDQISGTPEFMSPEQILNCAPDARSDIYSLGATAYYAFSGRFPFEGATATEVMAKQVSDAAPPLASLGVSVPRKVAGLVDRCLVKDPEHRIASAGALAEALGVALEQRRELPAALRAFVKRSARLDGNGTLAGVTVASFSIALAHGLWGWTGVAAATALSALMPAAYFVKAARQLSLQGFTHRDLPAAFRAELEQAEEEMTLVAAGPPSSLERWAPAAVRISAAVLGAGILGTTALMRTMVDLDAPDSIEQAALHALAYRVTQWSISYGAVALIGSTMIALVVGQKRRDVDTRFWERLWSGRVGRVAFAAARKLIGNRPVGAAMTHRATELSLGMAAEQLFESLPKATRQQLGDVPTVLGRLQQDASLLRARHDELQEALLACGDHAESEVYRELRDMRDTAQARLADAVASLETIRLDLLRLHAGADTIGSLTTHLGLAAEVSREVERIVAARADVERIMAFPRSRAATPA